MYEPIDNNTSHTLRVRAQGLRDSDGKSKIPALMEAAADQLAALQAERDDLRKALQEIQQIGERKVLQSRNRITKKTWSIDDAVAEIARAALAKYK